MLYTSPRHCCPCITKQCKSTGQVSFFSSLRRRLLRLIMSRRDVHSLQAASQLKKRVDIDLYTVWNSIRGQYKVPLSGVKEFDFPTDAGPFTTAEFYGCTVVITVDGKGVIIGHFAQESADPTDPTRQRACVAMNTKAVVDTQIIPKLENAWMKTDGNKNTQAWIITSASQHSYGYKAIVSTLEANDIETQNIHKYQYTGGSGVGSFSGPHGKAVVTWTPKPAGNGATLAVYIQDNSPIFTQDYGSDGNPVGVPGCSTSNSKHKRNGTCASGGAASVISSNASVVTPAASSVAPSITPAPTCYQQNEDPDQGIQQQGCICSQGTITKTLPILATGVNYSSSCAYTALLTASTIAITPNFGPPVTNAMICSVCSPTSDNRASCTSMPNCLPHTPTVTVQIGSSPVQVGTLTSTALSSAIASAISTLCPPVTQTTTLTTCDETNKVTIKDIAYIDDGTLAEDGELIIQIDSSGYNDTSLLGTLARMAAQSIASSATGANCYHATYTIDEFKKRWYSSILDTSFSWLPLYKRDHPYPVQQSIEMCHSGHFASPQIYSQWYVSSRVRSMPQSEPQRI